jgi:hypothetical protein
MFTFVYSKHSSCRSSLINLRFAFQKYSQKKEVKLEDTFSYVLLLNIMNVILTSINDTSLLCEINFKSKPPSFLSDQAAWGGEAHN